MIKAIDTRYGGYLFRSRLEARWAVFFDHLGFEWDYEIEGFETSRGRYLPDFWLRKYRTWVEVKPEGFKSFDSFDRLAGREVAVQQQTSFILVTGDPLAVLTAEGDDVAFSGFTLGGLCYWKDATKNGLGALNLVSWLDHEGRPKALSAAEQARQARFEHGATA